MISKLRDISLREKITISFVLIVLCGTAVSTFIGSRIITNAMRNEALKRVRHGILLPGRDMSAGHVCCRDRQLHQRTRMRDQHLHERQPLRGMRDCVHERARDDDVHRGHVYAVMQCWVGRL